MMKTMEQPRLLEPEQQEGKAQKIATSKKQLLNSQSHPFFFQKLSSLVRKVGEEQNDLRDHSIEHQHQQTPKERKSNI